MRCICVKEAAVGRHRLDALLIPLTFWAEQALEPQLHEPNLSRSSRDHSVNPAPTRTRTVFHSKSHLAQCKCTYLHLPFFV